MRVARARRVAWGVWALAIAFAIAAVVFLVLGRDTAPPAGSFGLRGFGILFAVVFGTVGSLIAARQPSNPLGWLLLFTGAASGVQEAAQQYAIWTLGESELPGGELAAWFPSWIWVPATASVITSLLLFPDGRLRSARWRPALVSVVAGCALASVGLAFLPGPLENFKAVQNPLAISALKTELLVSSGIGFLLYMVGVLSAAASLVLRFRAARGEERLQMKWIALAAAAASLTLGSSFVFVIPEVSGDFPDVIENLVILSFACVPVAMGVAILRYRLYDIDVVIKKTVVYAILAAFITLVYVAIVVGIGTIVGSGGNAFLSAVAAAVVALAFQPARRRAQRLANRLVYGKRATPYEVLSGFSERLAETYSVEDVLPRMARVLGEGVGAARVTILLGTDQSPTAVATWPQDATMAGSDPRSFEVRHQGRPFGAIEVVMPSGAPLDVTRQKLVADVAAQAGLVLRNAALIEDLRSSRQRLVAAQDQERRRIERNIHDGAQQQLVAIAVKLKLADSLLSSDLDRAHAMLETLRSETEQALEDLRDLARGIYPPLLADKGLPAALESQGRKSPIPVRIEADGIGRFHQETETAVYFSCLEALQNVAKYAEASVATVRLAEADGTLMFEVSDDGRGFDPSAASRGTGLQGIADRLAALGGDLEVRSSPGAGTTIAGAVPTTGDRA